MKSSGFKRFIASALAAITLIAGAIPSLAFLVPILSVIAGLFGGVGVLHAAAAGNIRAFPWSTIASVLAALQAVLVSVPGLEKYAPILQALAAIIGAFAAGDYVATYRLNSTRKNAK